MNTVGCVFCGKPVEVEDDFEYQGCCSGRECGCAGMPINPVWCEDCGKELEGR